MPESDIPNYFIKLIGSLGPFLIACIVSYIAYRQWITARDKLRLDLFDRRYAIYKGVIEALGLTQKDPSDEKISFSATIELHKFREESLFLFGEEVTQTIIEFNTAISKERFHHRQLKSAATLPDERVRHASEIEKIGNAYSETIGRFTSQCLPYMAFREKAAEPRTRNRI